ncbi:hypothetical protein B0181_09145 [Moraxella caviae]|uniref:Protein nucleotidyltransferase YdiU n=2 Tax=Moraxella caviae TaxID=34060 RepID=A0A1S9ZXF5_9GAMM|nr:protein adenylyltransferase SelO family protein [Moraxella caviae]OOR88123.1 hypothetical protein B0181_09145 [Moraxella caviae]STZ09952.1 Uncharacterized conserved protein [Moraxella caviae]VEW11641.1 Uncharacterized conserved protein [Moraxella caviae]
MRHHIIYTKLDDRLYHHQKTSPLDNPRLVHFNHALADALGFDAADKTLDWQAIIGADFTAFTPEFTPLAMVYAGHQFGHWAGQLGDGRGVLLTQILDKNNKLTDLHLKGAGLTPFSRMGDGRAMIGSSVREYLGSHALNVLGVPSSNALGLVVSDTLIRRHQAVPAAALLRTSDCHVRLGHFEWIMAYAPDLLPTFTQFCMAHYFDPDEHHQNEINHQSDSHQTNTKHQNPPTIEQFLRQVCRRTARMIADWQLVGFIHGVMNTDNLNITGSTLDFGPFAMMERFTPSWIANHSDDYGRYTYQNQPQIGAWNLQLWLRLFTSLGVHTHTVQACLDEYERTLRTHYEAGLCQKLGLAYDDNAIALAYDFLDLLKNYELDYTNSFRALIAVAYDSTDNSTDKSAHLHETNLLTTLEQEIARFGAHEQRTWQAWRTRYQKHLQTHATQAIAIMQRTNPVYVLRNPMAQNAIIALENGDTSELERIFTLLSTPFNVQDIATADDTTPTHRLEMTPVSCMS